MDGGEDYYALLNVRRDTSAQQIRAAFHRLSLRFHPDKTGRELDIFPRIQRAYEVLTSQSSRRIYDKYGESGLQQLTLRPKSQADLESQWRELVQKEQQSTLDALVGSKSNITLSWRAGLRPSPWAMLTSLYAGHSFHVPLQLHLPTILPPEVGTTVLEVSAHALAVPSAPAHALHQPSFQVQLRHTYSPAATFAVGISPLSRDWFTVTNLVHAASSSFAQIELHSGSPTVVLGTRFNAKASCYSKFDGNGVAIGLKGNGWTVESGVLYLKATYKRIYRTVTFRIAGTILPGGYDLGFGMSKMFGQARAGIGWGLGAKGVRINLSWSRLGQKLTLPIVFVDHPDLHDLSLLFLLPLTSIFLGERYILAPRRRRIHKQERERQRLALKGVTLQRKQAAEQTMQAVGPSVLSAQQAQRKAGGLYIHSAIYGTDAEQADVTLAMMALVDCNQLAIPSGVHKYRLIGFYDPAPYEKKKLRVEYEFHGRRARVTVGDEEGLVIPMRAHEI